MSVVPLCNTLIFYGLVVVSIDMLSECSGNALSHSTPRPCWGVRGTYKKKGTRHHPGYKYSDRSTENYSAFLHLLIVLAGVRALSP